MHAMTRAGLVLALCLGLAACPRPVQSPAPTPKVPSTSVPQTPAPAPSPPPKPAAQPQGEIYRIDAQASDLHILVFRGGTFARLGHNHVMSSKSLTGQVWMQPTFAASGFELSFPVANLIVDDPETRRAAGDEFPPEIPERDKEGTRKNMLRPEVLDGERYPRVTVKSATVAGSLQAPKITANITLKDATREVAVPVVIKMEGARLTASGEFEILQTDFGMKPFSVAMGALEVKDKLVIRFKLVAVKR